MAEMPTVMPPRGSKLSNKERLVLRKLALKMIKKPVLAVGMLLFDLYSFLLFFLAPLYPHRA